MDYGLLCITRSSVFVGLNSWSCGVCVCVPVAWHSKSVHMPYSTKTCQTMSPVPQAMLPRQCSPPQSSPRRHTMDFDKNIQKQYMNINDKKQHICILYIYNIIILLKQVFRWGPTKIKTRKSSVLLQLSQVWGICLALRCLSSPASATLGVSLELSSVVGMQYAWFRGDPSERPVQRVWKNKDLLWSQSLCVSITLKLNTMEHQLFTGPLIHAIRSRPACSATAAW